MKTFVKQGSSIIMILLLVSIISVVALSAWRTTVYSYELSLQRSSYQKNFAMAEGLLNYGILMIKANVKQIVAQNKDISLQTDAWPGKYSKKNQGQILISPNKNQIIVRAQVLEDNRIVCRLSCVIIEQKSEKEPKPLFVSNWAVDGAS
jgi:hypothetical protein